MVDQLSHKPLSAVGRRLRKYPRRGYLAQEMTTAHVALHDARMFPRAQSPALDYCLLTVNTHGVKVQKEIYRKARRHEMLRVHSFA